MTTDATLAGTMADSSFMLRPYTPADEDAAIALWLRTWQQTYPDIDFAARLDWWRGRWRNELVPQTRIVVAEKAGAMTGFVTVDPKTLYLDQIVVAPEAWGSGTAEALLAEARRLSPRGLDLQVNQDNARAIRFYQKQGFAIAGEDKNSSGRLTYWMKWRPT
ncbi:MAG TPA: GNAT family N-acetyltransferase [Xanthobacteraceae bacterium]|nr:GNAT family N-acetyltransferase [Xanthobacteraceae bacterium]